MRAHAEVEFGLFRFQFQTLLRSGEPIFPGRSLKLLAKVLGSFVWPTDNTSVLLQHHFAFLQQVPSTLWLNRTSLIQKRYVTDSGIQLTSFGAKKVTLPTGGSNWPCRCLEVKIATWRLFATPPYFCWQLRAGKTQSKVISSLFS